MQFNQFRKFRLADSRTFERHANMRTTCEHPSNTRPFEQPANIRATCEHSSNLRTLEQHANIRTFEQHATVRATCEHSSNMRTFEHANNMRTSEQHATIEAACEHSSNMRTCEHSSNMRAFDQHTSNMHPIRPIRRANATMTGGAPPPSLPCTATLPRWQFEAKLTQTKNMLSLFCFSYVLYRLVGLVFLHYAGANSARKVNFNA